MNILKLILLNVLCVGVLFSETIGLLSGSSFGTYIKIAEDIKEVTKEQMNIEVYSGGSLENIDKVLSDRHSQFAIIQYDALLYKKNILGMKNLEDKIKMLFPLYNEEIHIIVRKDRNIDSIKDLEGKKVNMDRKNSGCWVSATMIKKFHNLEWMEFNYPPKEALLKLTKGEIDAFIFVVGKPAPVLEKLPASAKNIIKLIHPEVSNFYPETTIKKETYSWLEEDIKTNVTKALLVTYNYEKNSAKRFNYYLDNIKKLSSIINDKLTYLRNNKHPKWKEINPYDTQGVKWPLHKLVKQSNITDCDQLATKDERQMCKALKEQ